MRLYELDWLRVIVFGLLILFHVGMVFIPWDYHLKNNIVTNDISIPMLFLSQWRLPLLFMISGMGVYFALAKRQWIGFIKERSIRLLIPLVFGILVIVSPQVYLERLAQGLDFGSFFNFYPEFFRGVYPTGNFSWNHLWFLPYLFIYCLILSPVFILYRNYMEKSLILFIKKILKKPISLLIPILPLILCDFALHDTFPVTRNLYKDWYAFTFYMLFFLYGYIFIVFREILIKNIDNFKLYALIFGTILFACRFLEHSFIPENIFYISSLWLYIIAILGYSTKYLKNDSKALQYLNKAVYPYYILHQTILLLIAFYLINSNLAIWIKFIIITFGTFSGVIILYEFIIRRVKILSFLFGVKINLKEK